MDKTKRAPEIDTELLEIIDGLIERSKNIAPLAQSVDELKAKLCAMGHKKYCKDIIVA
ncbi:MAG: hypothetical protein JJ920_08720 [Roseitalea sp.]|jgi:hypothetical protein|nr:hypothetical protein [Roseitalea sp.]MBO6722476.1 hypothetical protein [Roseitalea sp.]MBO6742980.1 hypothetical protein [Roseitalea sp.]